MVRSLIEANQNSASPKKATAMMFSNKMTIRMMAIQTPVCTLDVQYSMMMAPAVASAATRMAYAYL